MKITFTLAELKRMLRAKAVEFRARELSYGWEPADDDRTVRFIGGDGQSELSDSQISMVEIEL